MSSDTSSNIYNTGGVTKARTFSLSSYKRLEASNNYLNILSAILLLVALAMIPVIYFSLAAERDGVTTTSISGEIKGNRWSYNLELAPMLKDKSKKTELEVEIHVSRAINTDGPSALANYPKKITIPLYPKITNITVHILEEVEKSNLPDPVSCDEDKHHYCMKIQDFEIVQYTLEFGKGIRVWLQTPEGTDRKDFPITWGKVATDFSLQQPSYNLRAVDFCDDSYCDLGWTCNSSEEPKGTLRAISCNPHSSAWSTVIFDGGVSLNVQPYLQLATVGQSQDLLITQTLTFFRFINVPKYSTTDTLIDSFAISGLVISIVVLTVILLKLVLYAIFNPAKRT